MLTVHLPLLKSIRKIFSAVEEAYDLMVVIAIFPQLYSHAGETLALFIFREETISVESKCQHLKRRLDSRSRPTC